MPSGLLGKGLGPYSIQRNNTIAGPVVGNGLLNNLVAYWALDEASGNALDKHGGLTCLQGGSPLTDAGKVYSTARKFNGSNQYFSLSSNSSLITGDIDCAWAAWFYLDSIVAKRGLFGKGATGAREYFVFYDNTIGKLRFRVTVAGGTGIYVDTGGVEAARWHLVCAWHDSVADTINIKLDDNATQSLSHTGGIYIGNQTFQLSSNLDGVGYTLGRLGPVAFWKNRKLDATACTALWNSGNGLAYSALTV